MPIQDFTMQDMQNARNNITLTPDKDVKFILFPNMNSIKIHEQNECTDGDIVNLASQFNALESVSSSPIYKGN